MFRKEALILLAEVAGLHSICFNTARNELLNKFLRDIVKILEFFFSKMQTYKVQPSVLGVFIIQENY